MRLTLISDGLHSPSIVTSSPMISLIFSAPCGVKSASTTPSAVRSVKRWAKTFWAVPVTEELFGFMIVVLQERGADGAPAERRRVGEDGESPELDQPRGGGG